MRQPQTFTAEMGARLATVRADSGLPVTQFAASVDATEQDYLAWEAGQQEMPTQLLRALFDRYDVDVSWLISGQGQRYNGSEDVDP
ncbi:hypothetical protein GCM10010924_48760 [Rhizobium wenxiniae]|uniref:Transcriptional regulator with XRE-family HTH domain n=1 Tax=Rhizobium wenxiniae TaxID=1737357 RepID=A0A7W9YAY3_9HYPH|nr:helix-turn-helix domain-containing protein [Rhizobium wenxiniae]MBB6165240.1 transcriptional regulator with XRE-family HTH domain [Rhizobium wenxiniae]GGG13867.1 hypothetical protein GCM10010924_48760 [Rhizobium wenxiniae]